MAELTEQQKLEIHNKLYQAGKGMIPVQELTYAASQLCKDNSEENQVEVLRNLKQFSMPGVGATSVTETIAAEAVRDACDREQPIEEIIEEMHVNEWWEQKHPSKDVYPEDHISKKIAQSNISVGSVVTMGKYMQTQEAFSDDTKKTSVRWYVIKKDDENHKVMLLTKDAIEFMPWEDDLNDSNGRLYVNSNYHAFCENFYNNMLDEKEQKLVLTSSDLDNMVATSNDPNRLNNVKIFLPSGSELNKIIGLESPMNYCHATEYCDALAASKGQTIIKSNDNKYIVQTATRTSITSMDSDTFMQLIVNANTEVQSFSSFIKKNVSMCVRLAAWVSI